MPPLSVRPPTPVSEISPPGVARPMGLRRRSPRHPRSLRPRPRPAAVRDPPARHAWPTGRSSRRPRRPRARPRCVPPPRTEIGSRCARANAHRGDHVVGASRPDDDRGVTVDHGVPDGPGTVVARVVGREDRRPGWSRAGAPIARSSIPGSPSWPPLVAAIAADHGTKSVGSCAMLLETDCNESGRK